MDLRRAPLAPSRERKGQKREARPLRCGIGDARSATRHRLEAAVCEKMGLAGQKSPDMRGRERNFAHPVLDGVSCFRG